jgi:Flp pilus assembly pilin Flp
MSDPEPQPSQVYNWQTAIGVAALGTLAAVGLIVLFTYLVDWIGDFWSQVVYFVAVFGGRGFTFDFVFTLLSGIGIASGSISLGASGSGSASPFDSVATTFVFSA